MSKAREPDNTAQLLLFGDPVPLGNGQFKIVPQKPLGAELTPRQASRYLGVSRPTVYRLLDLGLFACRRPSPGKILIDVESLKKHRANSADPEFWDLSGNPSQASQASQAS